jgi:hypothetical protein
MKAAEPGGGGIHCPPDFLLVGDVNGVIRRAGVFFEQRFQLSRTAGKDGYRGALFQKQFGYRESYAMACPGNNRGFIPDIHNI